MRIISGIAKGKKILSPEGMETRPTLDRVKESIFGIIQNYIYDSTVLDVFAGTGSLGLEAVSRGAKLCYLVDKSPQTFPILKANIDNLKFNDVCKGFNMDSYVALREFARSGIIFDIIFIDPPYAKDMIPLAMDIIDENNLLHSEGIIVCKIDSKEDIYGGSDQIKIVDHRKYGNTTVCLYKHKEK